MNEQAPDAIADEDRIYCKDCGDEVEEIDDCGDILCYECREGRAFEEMVNFAMVGDFEPIPGEKRKMFADIAEARKAAGYTVAALNAHGGMTVVAEYRRV